MKKKHILFVCILLSVLMFSSCSTSFLDIIDVFDEMDISNYELLSSNYVWTECNPKSFDHDYTTDYYFAYYKIVDVPVQEYIGCTVSERGLFRGSDFPHVMRRKDSDHQLELDISSAELFLMGIPFVNDVGSYETELKKQQLTKVDATVAELVATDIYNFGVEAMPRPKDWWPHARPVRTATDTKRNNLAISFSIKDYPNILWIAKIYSYEGKYYLEIYSDFSYEYFSDYGDYSYLLCDDTMCSLIEKVIDEYGLTVD
ncbi:MAG: hypothetical protein IJ345_03320 [Clostridia bacterium]|nr:hypothetical protein [Clostridia bacterium]